MLTLNTKTLASQLERLIGGRKHARETAMRALVGQVIEHVVRNGPKDTNRYVRGWAMAGRSIGAYKGSIPSIQAGSNEESVLNALQNQVEYFEARVVKLEGVLASWYPPGKKRTDYCLKLEKELRKAKTNARKAQDTFDEAKANTGFIVFDLGRGAVYDGKYRPQKRRATIRAKAYGGYGSMRSVKDETTVVLTNREPHTRVVESRFPGLRKTLRVLRPYGIQVARAGYVRTLKKQLKGDIHV